MDYLSTDEVLEVHYAIARDVRATGDPIDPVGPRDLNLLESAVFRPQTAIAGSRKYPTIEVAAAALIHSLVLNHPFHNGNKRTALVSYLVFLDRNGVSLVCREDEVFNHVLRIARRALVPTDATGKSDREVLKIAEWTCSNSRLTYKGDRPIPWRKLKRILTDYGCEYEAAPRVGNRLNITRVTRIRTGWLGHEKTQRLHTQVYYPDDGREAAIDAVKKIRADLHLDYDNGIDAEDFYAKGALSVDDFIAHYRRTLDRLAAL